ncbi:MAG: TetR/AcrR family transcriptional regulator C-terminal domain-containing protein [Acidimicrobiales bacterium]
MTMDGRPNLSRDLIAETALQLTDDVGLAGLSMRKLGAELGVEAMSLYHYVDNKDDLLDAVLDRLYCEIDLPFHVADDQWEKAIREGLTAFNDVLLRHPAAVEIFTSRPAISPTALRVLHWAYQRFEAMGMTPAQSSVAFRFAVSFVMGHAANELGMSAVIHGEDGIEVSGVSDPEHRQFLLEHGKLTGEELFEAGLDLVIAGLRATYDRLL